MNKTNLLILLGFLFIGILLIGPKVYADTTASVTATVTAQNVSVQVADGSISYGTIGVGTSVSTAINDGDSLSDSQTATNNGNVTETLNIQGVDSGAWELADSPGSEAYSHKFCVSNCDATPSWTAFNETTYTQMITGVTGSGGTQVFDLILIAPSSTATYTQQTVSATVQAVAE